MDSNSVEIIRHRVSNTNRASVSPTAPSSGPLQPKANVETPSRLELENDSVELTQEARERLEAKVNAEGSTKFQRKLSVAGNKQVVMKLIDPETKNVVRQIPPEDLLRLREAIRNAAKDLEV